MCDEFADWCFYRAVGSEAQRIQCQVGELGAACVYSAQYYMMQGRYDQNPRPGDQVFFLVNGQIGHTGIVADVNAATVTVVERNSSDRVQRLNCDRGSARIAGYGHPRYDEIAEAAPAPVTGRTQRTVQCALPVLERGCAGNAVKNAQSLLIRFGGFCGGRVISGREVPDGDFGPATEQAVKAFQCSRNLESGGIIGAETWTALLTT